MLSLFFGYQLKNISFEHDLEDFFNKNENFYQFNRDFFNRFEGVNNDSKQKETLTLIVDSEDSITYSYLKNLESFSKDIRKITSVDKVNSVLNTPLFVFTAFGKYPYKIFHLNDSSSFEKDMQQLNAYQDVKNRFISKDFKSSLIYLTLEENCTIDSILRLKEQLLILSTIHDIPKLSFFNSTLTNYLVVKKLKDNSVILTLIAGFLILLILLLFFRSFIGLLVPLSIVILSIVWILGTIAYLDIPLNVLTIAIPVIVGVISLSDVIHIITRYAEENRGDSWLKIKLTQQDMLRAIVLTSVTTSLGFISLIPSQIQVFIEFGFFCTLGVVYAFILAYLLLPIFLFHAKPFGLTNYLVYITPKTIYTKPTIWISALLLVVISIGIYKVENQSYIYDDVNAKDEASMAIKKIEKDFYGVRDLSVAITFKNNKDILSLKNLSILNAVEQKVEELYGTSNFFSICLFIKQMNRAIHGGNSTYYKLPEDEKELKKIVAFIRKNKIVFAIDKLISKKKKSTYIYGKINDPGSNNIQVKNKELLAWVNKTYKKELTLAPTGGSHVIDQTNFTVTKTMLWSLTSIMVLIMVLIIVLFKSISLGLISLLPNMMPLMVIMAVVGWFNMGLNITITIVFTIVFGIAVDDTIHFLSKYRIEKRKNNLSPLEVIENCLKSTGGAIALTTVILVAGFGTLIFSDFRANFTTGLLSTIGLITAVLCDLFLLPVLLYFLLKKETKK